MEFHFHEAVNPDVMPIMRQIIDTQRKIMSSVAQLSQKVDTLQAAIDAEQEQIAAALATFQKTVDELKTEIVAGGTAAERQAIADKLDAAAVDVASSIADAAPPPAEPAEEQPEG